MTPCLPTMTLYGFRTFTVEEPRGVTTRTYTTVVPVANSTASVSVVRTTTVPVDPLCVGIRCVYTTRTVLYPLPVSTSTGVETFYSGGSTTVVAYPTATLYSSPGPGSSCTIPAATTTTHTPIASPSPTQTLVDPNGGDGSGGQRSINVGAIVGGLLGGFLTPILIVLLIRWLKRKGLLPTIRLPHPPAEMRSVHDRPLSPTLHRATSPVIAASLARNATVSDGGHSNITHTTVNSAAEQVALDRRASRASRVSRASYGSYGGDRRGGAISPVGSWQEFGVIAGGSAMAAAAAAAGTSGAGSSSSNVARRGSFGQSHPPVSFVPYPDFYNNTHPHSSSGGVAPIAPLPQAYYAGSSSGGGGGYVTPFEHRRAVGSVSLSDHPYAHAQPVPTGNGNGYLGAGNGNGYHGTASSNGSGYLNGNGNGSEYRAGSTSPAISEYLSAQSHGHGYLPSVEEQDHDYTPPPSRGLEIRNGEAASPSQAPERLDNAATASAAPTDGQDLAQDDDRTIRSASDENSNTTRTLAAS